MSRVKATEMTCASDTEKVEVCFRSNQLYRHYMKQKYSLSFNEHDSSNEELREEDVWDATGFQMFVLRLVVLSVVAEHGVNVYCN